MGISLEGDKMSRYTVQTDVTEEIQKELEKATGTIFKVGKYELAYGYDHAIFYFYQFFDSNGEVYLEEDTLFEGLSGARLGSILKLFDCPSHHSMMCYLDMEI